MRTGKLPLFLLYVLNLKYYNKYHKMKIKEIADAYDVQYILLPPDIINSICFKKENACKIINKLRFECCPILDCDVNRMGKGELPIFLFPNLCIEKFDDESCRDYLLRSCDEALNFVTNYPEYTNDVYFDLVI